MEILRTLATDEGIQKWGALFATIGVLEFVGDESLTGAFERALRHPVAKYIALGGLAVTGAHLLGVMPREIDPYYFVADKVEQWKDQN